MQITLLTENKKKEKNTEEINITDFIEVKGWKAVGNRLSFDTVKKITMDSEKVGVPAPIEEVILEDDPNDSDANDSHTVEAEVVQVTPIEPPQINGENGQLNLL
jgi:topoisomerase-4 subunit A